METDPGPPVDAMPANPKDGVPKGRTPWKCIPPRWEPLVTRRRSQAPRGRSPGTRLRPTGWHVVLSHLTVRAP